MKKKAVTPEPVPVNIVCSLCGEVWALHLQDDNGEVTTLECIRLLKAKATRPTFIPQPYPVYPQRPWPYWSVTTSGTVLDCINSSTTAGYTINAAEVTNTTATPKVLSASAA